MSIKTRYQPLGNYGATCDVFDDSIKQRLQVDDFEIVDARNQLPKTIHFWDTFGSSYNDGKGSALKVAEYASFFLTAGGFGIWALSKSEKTWWVNHAVERILNPTIFTQKVSDFHSLGISPQDAAKGIVPSKVRESYKGSPIDLKKIEKEVKFYKEKTIPRISKLINLVFIRLPREKRTEDKKCAFFALFVHQAMITRTQSEIHQELLINGLSSKVVQELGSEKDWAIEAILGILNEDKPISRKKNPYLGHSEKIPLIYTRTREVPEDLTQAVHYFKQAAEQGDPDAQFNLGVCYEEGRGVSEDLTQAVYWYKQAAEKEHSDAQCNLGVCYEEGRGVPEDLMQAVYWYKQSAEKGHPAAQFNLGICHEKGRGVPKDLTQAVYWYKQSAEKGDADAQFNLGVCYEKGRGVPEDLTQAVYWYKQSAEKGHPAAQCNLRIFYQLRI